MTKPLQIKAVDVDRDIAVLVSDELDASRGLAPADIDTYQSNEELLVYGHPRGMVAQLSSRVRLRLGDPKVELGDLLSSELKKKLRARHSPGYLVEVLSVEGEIAPGHSGAPLLNSKGRVVGVGNGGLDEGRGEITWAIPYSELRIVPRSDPEVQERLQELRRIGPGGLFSFSADEMAARDASELLTELLHFLNTSSSSQQTVAGTKVEFDSHVTTYFSSGGLQTSLGEVMLQSAPGEWSRLELRGVNIERPIPIAALSPQEGSFQEDVHIVECKGHLLRFAPHLRFTLRRTDGEMMEVDYSEEINDDFNVVTEEETEIVMRVYGRALADKARIVRLFDLLREHHK